MTEPDYLFNVAIYLRGDDLDPAHVSAVLGMAPSKSQFKGQRKVTPTNHAVVAKIGLWALAAETKSSDLPVLIEELALKIGDRGPVLTGIDGVEEVYLDVFVAVDADDDGGGTCEFQLSQENVRALDSFGIPVRFTVAVIKK
ncbi:MAG: hypothetical protein A2V58_01190 [Candidatus Muproteobacteria bacterium RBG_19FT_COMBO_61_10]|jgi:hypothetical protein|uniref:DUF4279 domain-containing protein n=1 Tax=Candidatus Muproteobacteria bacterium RBG_19FT_COMBO_61_10 TaxID=1817761 RepID=A0A1F6ULT4_9PROT|nr:MAG: hypothetical protein A2V58_01190 [Candidatus Muproteobacteria bacterium RBG_19FT_COMBO_61_10]